MRGFGMPNGAIGHDPDILHAIVDVFAALLDSRGEIDADTDFFDAGGNSILAARAVAGIRQRCGVALSMRDMFAARTAHELAGTVARKTMAGKA